MHLICCYTSDAPHLLLSLMHLILYHKHTAIKRIQKLSIQTAKPPVCHYTTTPQTTYFQFCCFIIQNTTVFFIFNNHTVHLEMSHMLAIHVKQPASLFSQFMQ